MLENTENTLYVGNIHYDATEAQLEELFSKVGTVLQITIMKDRKTEQPRGFAFIEMNGPDERAKAEEELHEIDFLGRDLVVRKVNARN